MREMQRQSSLVDELRGLFSDVPKLCPGNDMLQRIRGSAGDVRAHGVTASIFHISVCRGSPCGCPLYFSFYRLILSYLHPKRLVSVEGRGAGSNSIIEARLASCGGLTDYGCRCANLDRGVQSDSSFMGTHLRRTERIKMKIATLVMDVKAAQLMSQATIDTSWFGSFSLPPNQPNLRQTVIEATRLHSFHGGG